MPAETKIQPSGVFHIDTQSDQNYTLVIRSLHSISKARHAMHPEPATMRLARHLWLLAVLAITPLHAADCPSDRPIKKTVTSGMMTCTAVACVGPLRCPPDPPMLPPGARKSLLGADCYYAPTTDCNTCKQDTADICLSQEEFEKASR